MSLFFKRIVSLGLLALLIITQTGCGANPERKVSDSGFYLDTECTITVYDMDESEAAGLIAGAFDLCADYESKLSKTIEGSDVDRINNAGGKPVKVSEETLDVISLGLEAGKESDGAFDITVGQITDLWDFKAEDPKVPEEKDIREAVSTVGYENVKIDGDTVSLGGDAKIDLGGIAKGYISCKLAEYLEENGAEHAIINLGGNVVTIGSKPDGSDWNVGIQDPNAERQTVIGSTPAKDQAVITSGIYERKFEKDGKIYHHIIDPETGYPVENDIEGVTIKCASEDAGMCDAYSTICLLKGSAEGKKFIESKKGFEALFYKKDGTVVKTDGMDFEPAEE